MSFLEFIRYMKQKYEDEYTKQIYNCVEETYLLKRAALVKRIRYLQLNANELYRKTHDPYSMGVIDAYQVVLNMLEEKCTF